MISIQYCLMYDLQRSSMQDIREKTIPFPLPNFPNDLANCLAIKPLLLTAVDLSALLLTRRYNC